MLRSRSKMKANRVPCGCFEKGIGERDFIQRGAKGRGEANRSGGVIQDGKEERNQRKDESNLNPWLEK
jgi:hypothetical protein